MVHIHGLTKENIKVNGNKIRWMEKENLFGIKI